MSTESRAGQTIVLVHGHDFKPAAEVLLDLSTAAIAAGIERDYPEALPAWHDTRKHIAYYGDLSNGFLGGAGKSYDEALDVDDRRRALHALKCLRRRKDFGMRRYDKLPGKSAMPELAADLAAPLLGTIGLADRLIGSVAADVQEYWNAGSDFGNRVRRRVRTAIAEAMERDDHLMLVSHGSGCIATWDALWELSHDPAHAERFGHRKVHQWLTLGAPLGDSVVRRRLFGAGEKGGARHPANVLAWHNVSAEDDYLCHDSTLADDYRAMLKLRQISSIRDYRIYNVSVRYGRSNPHSSVGYLIHPRVAKIVADWLLQAGPGGGISSPPDIVL